MRLYKTTKSVLSVSPEPVKFLNGLTSNSLDKPRNAFLNIHGRIVATFDQLKIRDDTYFLVLEQAFVGDVLAHIDRFVKLSKAVVRPEDYSVYFDLDKAYATGRDEYIIEQQAGRIVITRKHLDINVDDEAFTLFRLRNNIPLQGADYRNELLLNVSEDEFVSFTKGCYLGQEPVSKVHHKSKPTWKLMVKYESECSKDEKAKMTSRAKDEKGRVLGFTFARNA